MAARDWKQKGLRMITAVIIGYGLVVLLAAIFQRRLLYFPTRVLPEQAESTARRAGFVPWKSQFGQTIGWKLPANGSPTGSVLVVHGNAGYALDRGYICEPIHAAAALDAFVFEYPGYGARPGAPGMKDFLAAGEEAFRTLPTNAPVYLVSESIGAGVVAHLAKTFPSQVAGLMLFAPYNDLGSVAQRQMPLLPAKWILRDRFLPAAWLANYRGPVKVVIAERDEIIPPRFGRQLYDSYNGRKELTVIPGVGHNDIAEQPPEWWQEVLEFWAPPGSRPAKIAQ
jgi:pimeloyl-ACP methyl ester carboxylesterase